MDPIDFIRDKFSQDCAVDTVLHLVMAQRFRNILKLWKGTENKRVCCGLGERDSEHPGEGNLECLWNNREGCAILW